MLQAPSDARVVDGVGINFPSLPDAGATARRRDPERRVWPGQALEGAIVRRVLPAYPTEQKPEARCLYSSNI